AALAAATARFTSSALASGTCAITSSVEGSYTGNVLADLLATHSPLMNIWYVLTSVCTPLGIMASRAKAPILISAASELPSPAEPMALSPIEFVARPCDAHTQRKRTPPAL